MVPRDASGRETPSRKRGKSFLVGLLVLGFSASAVVGTLRFRRARAIEAVEAAAKELANRGLTHWEAEHTCGCLQDPTPGAASCCPVRQFCGGTMHLRVGDLGPKDQLVVKTADGRECGLGAADIGLDQPELRLTYEGSMTEQLSYRVGVPHRFTVTASLETFGGEVRATAGGSALTGGRALPIAAPVTVVAR